MQRLVHKFECINKLWTKWWQIRAPDAKTDALLWLRTSDPPLNMPEPYSFLLMLGKLAERNNTSVCLYSGQREC